MSDQQRQVVASFEISFTRLLDAEGNAIASIPRWAQDPDIVLPVYRTMVQTRIFDRRALNLQRTGQLGTYGSPLGQEAIGAAVASCLQEDDVVIPSYREFSAQLHRGVQLQELLLFWGGDERGSDFSGPREDFPVCIPIATQALHAAGVACAFKYRHQARVAVCFIGDGGTSKGDFYEAMNIAGVWRLPVVFVVSNNQWAISVPRSRQTATQTLAQKAIAAGIHGEQVDGNDALAVRQVTLEAVNAARLSQQPCMIEAMTYRMGDHTTADDATRYRDSAAVERHASEDPIERLRNFLISLGMWSHEDDDTLVADCEYAVEEAVATYLKTEPQKPSTMFDFLYAELPPALDEQRQAVEEQTRD